MRAPGIYRILNLVNGRYYVGSSADILRRWGDHLAALRGSRHKNIHLQRAWNKYGEAAFRLDVLERAPVSDLFEVEQRHLDVALASGQSYNLHDRAEGGFSRIPEVVARHGVSVKLRSQRKEWKERHAANVQAQANDPEWRALVSEGTRRAMHRPEVRDRHISAIQAHKRKPEVIAQDRGFAARIWGDPEVARRTREAGHTQQAQSRRTTGVRRALAEPAMRQHLTNAQRRIWADPGKRAARLVAMRRGVVVRLVAPGGETHEVFNVAELCRTHGLDRRAINRVMSGEYAQYKGWTVAS